MDKFNRTYAFVDSNFNDNSSGVKHELLSKYLTEQLKYSSIKMKVI